MPDHYRDLRAGLSGLLTRQNRRIRLMANVAGLLCDLDEAERTIDLEQRISDLASQLIGPETSEDRYAPDLTGHPQPPDRPGTYPNQLQEAMRRASQEPLPSPQQRYVQPAIGDWDGRSLYPPHWGEPVQDRK